jgi:dihydroneopterin aldolase
MLDLPSLTAIAGREHLDQCMDYSHLYRFIMGREQRPHTNLLEPLAEELIEACFRDEAGKPGFEIISFSCPPSGH